MYIAKKRESADRLSPWVQAGPVGRASHKNILLSYPRSGNHLCRFFIELLSETPTFGCGNNADDGEIHKIAFSEHVPFNVKSYRKEDCYYKYHSPRFDSRNASSLIVLVRNPKEVLLRHHNYTLAYRPTDWQPSQSDDFETYFEIIDYYYSFKGKKLILFYEDMLTNKSAFIHKLYDFLSLNDKDKKRYVLDNLDKLFNLSLGGKYSWGGNISGNQLDYYYKNIPSRIKADFDRYIDGKLAKYRILQRFKAPALLRGLENHAIMKAPTLLRGLENHTRVKAKKTFYICSYGGCGSKMLTSALSKYGSVEHVHARNPPLSLEYTGSNNGGKAYLRAPRVYHEWFNGIPVPDNEICHYYVIYLYRNPVKAILSIFRHPRHLANIQGNENNKTTIQNVMTEMKDLYGIKQFYENYTRRNERRNYRILCVKYEDIFEKQNELSRYLGAGKLNLVKRETRRNEPEITDKLNFIYKDLIDEMNRNNFISIS